MMINASRTAGLGLPLQADSLTIRKIGLETAPAVTARSGCAARQTNPRQRRSYVWLSGPNCDEPLTDSGPRGATHRGPARLTRRHRPGPYRALRHPALRLEPSQPRPRLTRRLRAFTRELARRSELARPRRGPRAPASRAQGGWAHHARRRRPSRAARRRRAAGSCRALPAGRGRWPGAGSRRSSLSPPAGASSLGYGARPCPARLLKWERRRRLLLLHLLLLLRLRARLVVVPEAVRGETSRPPARGLCRCVAGSLARAVPLLPAARLRALPGCEVLF